MPRYWEARRATFMMTQGELVARREHLRAQHSGDYVWHETPAGTAELFELDAIEDELTARERRVLHQLRRAESAGFFGEGLKPEDLLAAGTTATIERLERQTVAPYIHPAPVMHRVRGALVVDFAGEDSKLQELVIRLRDELNDCVVNVLPKALNHHRLHRIGISYLTPEARTAALAALAAAGWDADSVQDWQR